jgi:hypothetical protein
MMDWGSQKAEQAARRAADTLNKFLEQREQQDYLFENDSSIPEQVKRETLEFRKRPGMSLHQYGFRYQVAYAGYDQPKDRIVVGALVVPQNSLHTGKIDAESCLGLMRDFRDHLIIMGTTKDGVPQDAVAWFSHNGYQMNPMPPNFAIDLAQHIATVINLDDYPNATDPKMKCEQPLMPLIGGQVGIFAKGK